MEPGRQILAEWKYEYNIVNVLSIAGVCMGTRVFCDIEKLRDLSQIKESVKSGGVLKIEVKQHDYQRWRKQQFQEQLETRQFDQFRGFKF